MMPQPMRTGATFSAAIVGAARQQANAATINFTQRFISNVPVRKSFRNLRARLVEEHMRNSPTGAARRELTQY
jgi:hypothetical protein